MSVRYEITSDWKCTFKCAPESKFRTVPSVSCVTWRSQYTEHNLYLSWFLSLLSQQIAESRWIMSQREVTAWLFFVIRSPIAELAVNHAYTHLAAPRLRHATFFFSRSSFWSVTSCFVPSFPFSRWLLTGHPKDVPNWIKISVQRSKSGT